MSKTELWTDVIYKLIKRVACDNPHCKFEWFHLECLNLKEIPPED